MRIDRFIELAVESYISKVNKGKIEFSQATAQRFIEFDLIGAGSKNRNEYEKVVVSVLDDFIDVVFIVYYVDNGVYRGELFECSLRFRIERRDNIIFIENITRNGNRGLSVVDMIERGKSLAFKSLQSLIDEQFKKELWISGGK